MKNLWSKKWTRMLVLVVMCGVLALAVAPVAVCELEKRVRRKQPGRDDRRGIPNGVKGHT